MANSDATTDFPIPADLPHFWQWDKLHFPRPLTPLTEEIFMPAAGEGFCTAMEEYACPFAFQTLVINHFGYSALTPVDAGSETPEERLARHQEILSQLLPRMGELWEQEWLPSILPGLEKARATDYAALNDEQLLDTLDEMRGGLLERWLVHGRINFVTVSASWFADFYDETFEPEDSTEPYQVLQGFPTLSVDAGRGLWQLSRIIKHSATLKELFETLELSELQLQLQRSDEGRAFLSDFQAYLDEFGWRSDGFELADPTWREHPVIPLNTLHGYIYLDDDADPEVRFQQAVQRRETLLAQARQRLVGEPDKLARFNELYEMARHYLPITENHNYYIDQIGDAVMRLPILEIGRRLVRRGALAEEHDVFLLYLADIQQAFSGTNQQTLVAQRRADLDAWSRVVPPAAIGEPPPESDDPFVQAITKMYGMPPEPSQDPDVITGIGASPGTVQGKAKVVRDLSEASKIDPGDIMVCEMTMPPWTPLFSTVSALVADTGGALSHCAIVSREYRLPCVVGTVVGTSVIKDGMLLTVDGSKGIVRIDSRV